MVDENKPVKCSECNVWWRGLEHMCKKTPTKTEYNPYETTVKKYYRPNYASPKFHEGDTWPWKPIV